MKHIIRTEEGDVYFEVFPNGVIIQSNPVNTEGMISPVRCTHCSTIYDLCSVTPIARYADCTTFKSPCCNKHVDDREWKGMPDIKRLKK